MFILILNSIIIHPDLGIFTSEYSVKNLHILYVDGSVPHLFWKKVRIRYVYAQDFTNKSATLRFLTWFSKKIGYPYIFSKSHRFTLRFSLCKSLCKRKVYGFRLPIPESVFNSVHQSIYGHVCRSYQLDHRLKSVLMLKILRISKLSTWALNNTYHENLSIRSVR